MTFHFCVKIDILLKVNNHPRLEITDGIMKEGRESEREREFFSFNSSVEVKIWLLSSPYIPTSKLQ